MREEIFYLVTAYRWGSRENHSYYCGLKETEEDATILAEEIEQDRGGKYECEILEIDLHNPNHRIRIRRIWCDDNRPDEECLRCFYCGAHKVDWIQTDDNHKNGMPCLGPGCIHCDEEEADE